MKNPLKVITRKAGIITTMVGVGAAIGGALDLFLDTGGKCAAVGTLLGAGLGAISPEEQGEGEYVYVSEEEPPHYHEYSGKV